MFVVSIIIIISLILTHEDKCRQSKAVTQKVLQDAWYVKANSISIYLHMDDEIQTLDILKDALR